MRLFTVLLDLAVIWLFLHPTAAKQLRLKLSPNDDQLSVEADFAAYKKEIGLTLNNQLEEAKAKKAFELVRMESKLKPGRVAITEFSHIPLDELVKFRTGFAYPSVEPQRTSTLPKFNPRRYKGQLQKSLKAMSDENHNGTVRDKRQTARLNWISYVNLMVAYGYNKSIFEPVVEKNMNVRKYSSIVLPDFSLTSVPKSLDWRNFGIVTPVRNQGRCGCCWAFGTVAAIESQRALCMENLDVKGPDNDLSEQELVNCYKNDCKGHDPANALHWIGKHGGLPLESTFPYKQAKNKTVGRCPTKPHPVAPSSKVSAIIHLAKGNETLLKVALAYGPVVVCINASSIDLMHYDKTVDFWEGDDTLQGCNHEVLLIGYGTDRKLGDFWIIKNSWGADWGNKGFARIPRNQGSVRGITNYALVITLAGCQA